MEFKTSYSSAFHSMFREYDIRGRVNEQELNDKNVYRIVKAYGLYLEKRGISRAVVGYDNRSCSQGFANAALNALAEMGIEVFYVGLTLTPVVYYAQYHYECEGACMITASHNPDGWSGFKFANGYSKTLETADITELYSYLDCEEEVSSSRTRGELHTVDIREAYIRQIVDRIHMGPARPRIVLDAANGGAGLFIYEVFQRLGCLTFQLNCDPDITYPHYFPNPSDIRSRERMKEMVLHPYIKADLGISFDGDGDRLGVIDNAGNNIWSDTILALLAKQLLEKKPGATIIFDVKCTQALIDVITEDGGIPVMWKTGHSYIKAKLAELGADLAGERSGHIFISGEDYYGFDDAIFAAAKLVEYLSHQRMPLTNILHRLPHYVTSPEIKAHCEDEVKYQVTDRLVNELKERYPGKVIDINGARVQFDHGFGLIRASSNLPELVLIFEADTMFHLLEIRKEIKTITSKYPEISDQWENDYI